MKINSTAFKHNCLVPKKYTCDGENINPSLLISDVPLNTQSLVLIVDDPDAPGRIWIHWVVFNIAPTVKEVPENSIPRGGTEAMTDFGKTGYGGPCPPASTQRGEPSGTHRYFFKLYALDTILDLQSSATKNDIEEQMKNHIIDSTELIGLYKRS